jgi:uncharacterized protein YbaR (Trm112 family)
LVFKEISLSGEKKELVLEIGAGGNPYPRANVLLDGEEESVERAERELVKDRPLVIGLAEKMPFKDKSFDFIIASHVLEHTDDPRAFLTELMRVGKAGYIETPEAWFEKMCAYTFHRIEVSEEKGKLFINKKKNWKPDPISKLYENKLAFDPVFSKFLRLNPDLNHLRFFWNETIEFEILNDDVDCSWNYPEELNSISIDINDTSLTEKVRQSYLSLRRFIMSQKSRNKNIDLISLIQCVDCNSDDIISLDNSIKCNSCSREYTVKGGIPQMRPSNIIGFIRGDAKQD